MCLMLCVPLDWQYAELPCSARDEVLCIVVDAGHLTKFEKRMKKICCEYLKIFSTMCFKQKTIFVFLDVSIIERQWSRSHINSCTDSPC